MIPSKESAALINELRRLVNECVGPAGTDRAITCQQFRDEADLIISRHRSSGQEAGRTDWNLNIRR